MATCMTWTHHNFLACVCTLCWGKRHEAARSMKMDKTMYQHLALIQKFSMLHTYWSIFSAEWFQVKEVIFIIHISKGTPTCSDTWYHTVHDPYQAKKLLFLWIARVWYYTKEPTDTTRNGTSPGLKEKLCNSAGQKLDREVSLCVAAWRRWTSAIRKSRLSMGAWQREAILFYESSLSTSLIFWLAIVIWSVRKCTCAIPANLR